MKLFIWGTGEGSCTIVGHYVKNEDISGFIDNDQNKKEYLGKKIYRPEEIKNMEYDAILIANSYSSETHQQCTDIGIDLKKVIFLYNNLLLTDMNSNYDFVKEILGVEYAEILQSKYLPIKRVEPYGDLFLNDSPFQVTNHVDRDYVRFKSFELAVKEIRKRNIEGSVAELGVFRGEFAQYINYAFPNKKCYLFDTFEGFNATEALHEMKSGNCTQAFIDFYKQTNLGEVLDKMTYIDNVEIKQGLFPESLNGLEDKFAFVSIDVDFEESIYEGLKYFYPRLSTGGYIFIHDYNSSLLGVEKAVDRYEQLNKTLIAKVPICDGCGTLVITK